VTTATDRAVKVTPLRGGLRPALTALPQPRLPGHFSALVQPGRHASRHQPNGQKVPAEGRRSA